jgi:hypothetical protein
MRSIIQFIILFFSITFSSFTQNYWAQIAQLPSTVECLTSKGDTLIAGTLGSGVYISYNGGDNWTQINSGLINHNVYSAVIGTGVLLAGTDSSGVFISTNYGSSWVHTALTTHYKVKALTISTDGYIFAGTFGDGVFRSTDNGTNWTHYLAGDSVEALAVHQGGHILSGLRNPDGLFLSTDKGITWTVVDTEAHAFNTISVSPFNNDIYAITGELITDNLIGDVIVRSTNAGMTWNTTYSFATSSFGMAINSLGHIFVGRYIGTWESTDNGANWVVHNSGINTANGILLTYCINRGGYILAGQEGGSIYRSVGSTIGIRKLSTDVPKEFKLFQNNPNPFNPTTKIKFVIAQSPLYERGAGGFIILKIYDILGREVATLVSEKLKAGVYEVEWDASQNPSGIYFYRFTSGTFNETKKMILIK